MFIFDTHNPWVKHIQIKSTLYTMWPWTRNPTGGKVIHTHILFLNRLKLKAIWYLIHRQWLAFLNPLFFSSKEKHDRLNCFCFAIKVHVTTTYEISLLWVQFEVVVLFCGRKLEHPEKNETTKQPLPCLVTTNFFSRQCWGSNTDCIRENIVH